jgi:tungstate transport system ATP-binding protein
MHAPFSILPLRVEGLCYAVHGRTLLDGLSFQIQAHRRTVVMGPNGAGKSLTLRLCHGLIQPTSGRIEWNGLAQAETSKAHAMVFQRPVLLRRSALANLTHALSLSSTPRSARPARGREALERYGLSALAPRPARVLSIGEQQRLAMARAWAMNPQVMFMDEPTAALDPAAKRAVEAMAEAFHAEGMTIVLATHDLAQARRLADDVLFLHNGRLLEHTPAAEFFERPRSEAARSFLKGELGW